MAGAERNVDGTPRARDEKVQQGLVLRLELVTNVFLAVVPSSATSATNLMSPRSSKALCFFSFSLPDMT